MDKECIVQLSIDNARSLRASVVRALLNTHDYNASPHAIFALLTKPSLDPEFARHLSALNPFRRTYTTPQDVSGLRSLVHQCTDTVDGPIARAKQLLQHPVFGETMEALLNNQLHPQKFQHQLREAFRRNVWKLLCRDRPQHFAGTNPGINRQATLQWLTELCAEADMLQSQCDGGEALNPLLSEDPRVKLKVLRLLLSAGLRNPERQHRHKKHSGTIQCICKQGEPSLEHISWFCPKFHALRAPIMHLISASIEQLPACFGCCAIIPKPLDISIDNTREIQKVLVKIWQSHIDDGYNGSEQSCNIDSSDVVTNPANSSTTQSVAAPQKGHVLQILDEGGVVCRKCGQSTKYLKHQRLKIL